MNFPSGNPSSTSPSPTSTSNGIQQISSNSTKVSFLLPNSTLNNQLSMTSSASNILSSVSNSPISGSININGTNNGLTMQSGINSQPRSSLPPRPVVSSSATDTPNIGRPLTTNNSTQETFNKVLSFLQLNNLKESEEVLRKEYQALLNKNPSTSTSTGFNGDTYFAALDGYITYVQDQPDTSRHEFAQLIYPLFVHMYLELIEKDQLESAQNFFQKYVSNDSLQAMVFAVHNDDLHRIRSLTSKEQIAQSEYVKSFRQNGRYWVKLCNASLELLDQFLIKQQKYPLLTKIVQVYFQLEINDGSARNPETQQLLSGGRLGEIKSEDNSNRMFYGLLRDHDLTKILQNKALLGSSAGGENEDGTIDDQPITGKARKRARRDALNQRQSKTSLKVDPNAPPLTRIPIPELREHERTDLINTYYGRERTKGKHSECILF